MIGNDKRTLVGFVDPANNPPAAQEDLQAMTVTEVVEWVGDDPGRAQRALETEQAAENPRKSLIEQLEQ